MKKWLDETPGWSDAIAAVAIGISLTLGLLDQWHSNYARAACELLWALIWGLAYCFRAIVKKS